MNPVLHVGLSGGSQRDPPPQLNSLRHAIYTALLFCPVLLTAQIEISSTLKYVI